MKTVKKPFPAYLTTPEVAKMLGVTERTVRNMIERGSIYAFKIDPTAKSVYRIPQKEVERLLEDRSD